MTHRVLAALGLTANESGTYLGSGEWSKTSDAGVIEPINPSDAQVLARVHASPDQYDQLLRCAATAQGIKFDF